MPRNSQSIQPYVKIRKRQAKISFIKIQYFELSAFTIIKRRAAINKTYAGNITIEVDQGRECIYTSKRLLWRIRF